MSATLSPASTSERRIATRRQPTLGTVCRLTSGTGVPILGLVWNLSTTGVSMLLTDPHPSGSVLTGELMTVDRVSVRPVTLKVVHVKKIETGDYLMGAQFDAPLDADEMAPFVA